MAKKPDRTKPLTSVTQKPDPGKKPIQIGSDALPRVSIQDSLRVVSAIHKNIPGKGTKWKEIAGLLAVGATTQKNKYPLWAATAYGMLTRNDDNSYQVAETGRKIVAPEYDGEDAEGKIKALLTPTLLSRFFTEYNGRRLPEQQHLPNILANRYQLPRERIEEAIELIRENGQFAGVLIPQAEGEDLVRLDGSGTQTDPISPAPAVDVEPLAPQKATVAPGLKYDWATICFFITPIGDEGSEARKHADMVLKHVLTPVAQAHGLTVVRADKMDRPGLITQQIFEQLVRAKLCVADLSFSNPNVFYELGVRHTCKLPTIQLIRRGDKIPFDVAQGRTIIIDTSDVHTVTDRLLAAQKEVGEQVKHIMTAATSEPSEDNPIHVYLPALTVRIG